ncbi:hypothetical protein AC1031_015794 [Aphanomyces cochlioides]|nr:hypothetical protein AC1031_015794 [Aphanomyces cochlioides]
MSRFLAADTNNKKETFWCYFAAVLTSEVGVGVSAKRLRDKYKKVKHEFKAHCDDVGRTGIVEIRQSHHDNCTFFRIRAQRVQRLQFLVQTDNEEPSLWFVLPKQLFRRCMEPFARYSSWDCLMYHPNHNTNHMRLEVLPLLWRKIWANWHRIPLTRKCPETPTQSQLLTMSVWLQIHPLFLVPGSNGPTSLAVALKHHRPFYKFLAQEGLHCLDDFVTTQRVWPSYEEFKLQMEPYVWRFPGDDFPRVFRHLYSLLSLIATTV